MPRKKPTLSTGTGSGDAETVSLPGTKPNTSKESGSEGAIGISVRELLKNSNDELVYKKAIADNNLDAAEKLVEDKGFEALPDGRLIGYRVSQFKDGRAVSGADSRQSSGLNPGDKVKFSGNGTYVTPYPKYALDHYAVHDNNVIQKVAFEEKNVTTGDKNDREPELSITEGEVLDSEAFADGEEPKRLNKIDPVVRDQDGNIIPLSQRFPRYGQQILQNNQGNTAAPPPPPPPTPPAGGNSGGSNQPPKKFPNSDSPISEILNGNEQSQSFVENAKSQNFTPEEWKNKLAKIEEEMLRLDANNEFTLSDDDFNKEIGDLVIENMKKQNAQNQQGVLKTLPNTGKVIVIGDLHEQSDNLLSILKDIQSNPETNLDKNPDVKIMFLGDIFSGNKTGPNSRVGHQDGELINRLTTLLMAKYPDQIHSIMGNHDMGIITGEKYINDPTFKLKEFSLTEKDQIKNDPNLTQDEKDKLLSYLDDYDIKRSMMLSDAASSHPDSTGATTNKKHMVEKINNTPLATVIGDKSKGETVRLFVHSPPSNHMPELNILKNASSVQDVADDPQNALLTIMMGEPDIVKNPKKLRALLDKMGVDEIYFGHFGTHSLMDNGKPILNKTDNVLDSPLGSFEGGGNYIDSQGKDSNSGYMIVDLDKDVSSSKKMSNVISASGSDPAIDKTKTIGSKVVSAKAAQNAQDFKNRFKNFMITDMMR